MPLRKRQNSSLNKGDVRSGSKSEELTTSKCFPLFPQWRTLPAAISFQNHRAVFCDSHNDRLWNGSGSSVGMRLEVKMVRSLLARRLIGLGSPPRASFMCLDFDG
jgi:hypothetical protein